MAIARALEGREKEAARERQTAGQFGGSGNLPEPESKGDTRDKLAAAVLLGESCHKETGKTRDKLAGGSFSTSQKLFRFIFGDDKEIALRRGTL